jgi:general secretion pathway protein F
VHLSIRADCLKLYIDISPIKINWNELNEKPYPQPYTQLCYLLGYVVPKFSAVYESSGRSVPWLSSVLLNLGGLINNHFLIVLMGLLVTLSAAFLFFLHQPLRTAGIDLCLQAPLLAPKVREFRLARFYRSISLLLVSGIPLPRALRMVRELLDHMQRNLLDEAIRSVESGVALSRSLSENNLSTAVATSLIRVGEKSGNLVDQLSNAARFHDEEFERWIDWVAKLLEPLLMVAIGGVIGGIVVLLYVPIFELAGSLQ